MTSPILFSTGSSPASVSTSRNLVEFKAGKMELRDKLVHPIKRQGLVYLRQSPDDNLMHFCWKDRRTGVTEDDLILFPDDCEFKRVKECTTGRVFVLKMKSSDKKMFFWMQEGKSDKDEEFCRKINEMLNNPPRAGSDLGVGGGVGGGGARGLASERDIQALFGNMTQEEVTQLLNSNGVNIASILNSATGRSPSTNSGASASSTAGSTAPNSATSATSASNLSSVAREAAEMNDFRALISGALMEGNDDEAMIAATLQASRNDISDPSQQQQSSQGQHQQQEQNLLIDLSTAMNSESLAHLLTDEEFLKTIEPHLPPVAQQQANLSSEERKKQFGETIRSSQFRSSLSQFCVALQSGQLGPLMSQFGLNEACVDAANLGNLEAFVRALDAQTKDSSKSAPSTESSSGETKDKKN